MTLDDVSTQTDVSTDTSTPASSEPASSAPATGEEQTASQQDNVPFHEHPRFKELIEQKNQYQERMSQFEKQIQSMQQQYEQRLQQMQSQLQPQPKAYDPSKFLQRAKEIDPDFAQTLEWQVEQQRQLQQRIESMNQERTRETAYNQLNSLFEQNKVPANLREHYQEAIEAAAYKNPNFKLSDLPNLFKSTHDRYTKFLDEMKRQERASYVDQKKKDVTPATQTGGTAAKTGQGPDLSTFEKRAAYLAEELKRSKQKI